jgi:acyl-CoA thioesterase FadM
MSILLRTAFMVVRSLRQPRLGLLDASRLKLRVLPNDLDLNAHMNNGRYLTLMDLGRLDLVIRTQLGKAVIRERWKPLVGSATIRFRKSLAPFEPFTLVSRVLSWDSKWIYMDQSFFRDDELIAQAYVRGLFRGKNGNVPTEQLLEEAGYPGFQSPQISSDLQGWLAAQG